MEGKGPSDDYEAQTSTTAAFYLADSSVKAFPWTPDKSAGGNDEYFLGSRPLPKASRSRKSRFAFLLFALSAVVIAGLALFYRARLQRFASGQLHHATVGDLLDGTSRASTMSTVQGFKADEVFETSRSSLIKPDEVDYVHVTVEPPASVRLVSAYPEAEEVAHTYTAVKPLETASLIPVEPDGVFLVETSHDGLRASGDSPFVPKEQPEDAKQDVKPFYPPVSCMQRPLCKALSILKN